MITSALSLIYKQIGNSSDTYLNSKILAIPLHNFEAAEKVDTTAYIWYNIIIKYRRWYHG